YVVSEGNGWIWITHYSKIGVYLWQTDPLARGRFGLFVAFDQNDVPHVLMSEPFIQERCALLRFQSHDPIYLWSSPNTFTNRFPFSLRLAADGVFEAITADSEKKGAPGWLTTISTAPLTLDIIVHTNEPFVLAVGAVNFGHVLSDVALRFGG